MVVHGRTVLYLLPYARAAVSASLDLVLAPSDDDYEPDRVHSSVVPMLRRRETNCFRRRRRVRRRSPVFTTTIIIIIIPRTRYLLRRSG